MSVRPFSVRPYVRIFWEFYASWQAPATTFLDPYVQAKSQEAKNRSEKTDFKAGKERSSRKCFWKRSEKLSSGYDARKYRIVFCWIHMIGVKPPKNQHFQPVNTSNTSDWRVRTNLNGTAQKPWGPPLPRGCNLVWFGKVTDFSTAFRGGGEQKLWMFPEQKLLNFGSRKLSRLQKMWLVAGCFFSEITRNSRWVSLGNWLISGTLRNIFLFLMSDLASGKPRSHENSAHEILGMTEKKTENIVGKINTVKRFYDYNSTSMTLHSTQGRAWHHPPGTEGVIYPTRFFLGPW